MTQIAEGTAEMVREFQLTAADRCDSCGAQAYVRATLAAGDLLFCAHHAARFRERLAPTVLEWHDESERLLDEAPV